MRLILLVPTFFCLIRSMRTQEIAAKAVVHLAETFIQGHSLSGIPARRGVVDFSQPFPSAPVHIRGVISGLKPGKHGLHIHELGNLENGCKSAAGHYNPMKESHGGVFSEMRHMGDLGNIIAEDNGRAEINIKHIGISLIGPLSVIGRMIVVDAGEDDLGLGNHPLSLLTGNSGAHAGCGVIGIATEDFNVMSPVMTVGPHLIPKSDIQATVAVHNAEMLGTQLTPDSGIYQHGVVTFRQKAGERRVSVKGVIGGLTPGRHGFHIHSLGSIDKGCSSAGGHFNPEKKSHGARWDFDRHVGDLGNIDAGPDGVAQISMEDTVIQLLGPHSILGRVLVLHSKEDDLGQGDNRESLITGNAGPRVGCGVVGVGSLGYNPIAGWAAVLPSEISPEIPKKPQQSRPQKFDSSKTNGVEPSRKSHPNPISDKTPVIPATLGLFSLFGVTPEPRQHKPRLPQFPRNPRKFGNTIPSVTPHPESATETSFIQTTREEDAMTFAKSRPTSPTTTKRPTVKTPRVQELPASRSSEAGLNIDVPRLILPPPPSRIRQPTTPSEAPLVVPLSHQPIATTQKPSTTDAGLFLRHGKPSWSGQRVKPGRLVSRPHSQSYSCQRIPFQSVCKNGAKSQYTFRWHLDRVVGVCSPYPWGYCREEHDLMRHPALRSLEECEILCMGKGRRTT